MKDGRKLRKEYKKGREVDSERRKKKTRKSKEGSTESKVRKQSDQILAFS